MIKESETDFCPVCEKEFIRKHPKQVTCGKKQCQKEWKSGCKRTKIKKTYDCLGCGQKTTRGNICKKCSIKNAKIQEWPNLW